MISKTALKPERAPDPRPARTRAAIISAIERLSERGGELSVSSVVVEASLSRSSFYSQFNDIGDVAVQLVRAHYDQTDTPTESFAAVKFLLSEFETHRHLYSAVLGNTAVVSAEWAVCEIIADAWAPMLATVAPSTVQPEFAARFLASGTLAIIVGWLRSEHPADVDVVAAQVVKMLPSWVGSEHKH